ncbi:hypothetical protein [Legionella saoudiensis]|uniref:hypothetical protein n=1 Tax=Legionella saoudiensis TaxID=1750561 RepID=UPI000731CFD8|nr:hypothetical protein [Legionella saoudiensis]
MKVFEEIPNFDNQSKSEKLASLNQYFSAKRRQYLQENKSFLSLNHDAARIEQAEFTYINTQKRLNAMHYADLIDWDDYKRQSQENWEQCQNAFQDCFEHREAPANLSFPVKQTGFIAVRMHAQAHAEYRKAQQELNKSWRDGKISRKDFLQKSQTIYENCLKVFIAEGTNNYPPDISECKSYDDKKPKSYTRDVYIISQLHATGLISDKQRQFCVTYLNQNTPDIEKKDILPTAAPRKNKAKLEKTFLRGQTLQLTSQSETSSIEIQAPNLDNLFSEPNPLKRKQSEISVKDSPKKKEKHNDLSVSVPEKSKSKQVANNENKPSGRDKYDRLAFNILKNSHVKSLDNSLRHSQGLGNLTSNPSYYFHQSVQSEQDAMNFMRKFWSDAKNCEAVQQYHYDSHQQNKYAGNDSSPACISFVSTSVSIPTQAKSDVCYVALSGHKYKPGRSGIMKHLDAFIDKLNKESTTHYELVYGDIQNYNDTLKLLINNQRVNTTKPCAEKYFGSLLVKLYYEFGEHFTVDGITNCGFYPFNNTEAYGYGNTEHKHNKTVSNPQTYNDDEVRNHKPGKDYDRHEKMTMHLSLDQEPMNTSESDDEDIDSVTYHNRILGLESAAVDVVIPERVRDENYAGTRPCCKDCCAVKPAVMKLINYAQKYGHGAELGADRICTSPVSHSLPHYPSYEWKYREPGSAKETITELNAFGLFGQFKETRKPVPKRGSENIQESQHNLGSSAKLN